MNLVARWSVQGQPISLLDVCRITGEPQTRVKQLYRSGELGPAPNMSREVISIPLYHVAALFVLLEASKQKIIWETVFEILPVIAGATYIEFQLSELKAGRCSQRGGTPDLNVQLWTNLQSPQAKSYLEQHLPGGPIDTKRFAMLSSSGWLTADESRDALGADGAAKILDARSIASAMKKGLSGTLIQTHIA